MAIISVSRWKGPNDLSLAKDAAPMLKKHGATSVQIGTVYMGEYCGLHVIVMAYPDWTAYGNAMQTMLADPDYQTLLKAAADAGFELQGRSLVVADQM